MGISNSKLNLNIHSPKSTDGYVVYPWELETLKLEKLEAR